MPDCLPALLVKGIAVLPGKEKDSYCEIFFNLFRKLDNQSIGTERSHTNPVYIVLKSHPEHALSQRTGFIDSREIRNVLRLTYINPDGPFRYNTSNAIREIHFTTRFALPWSGVQK
jgi:hypothetical protein